MNSTKESTDVLTAKGVCDIIRQAEKSGATSIKWGDLTIEFYKEPDNIDSSSIEKEQESTDKGWSRSSATVEEVEIDDMKARSQEEEASTDLMLIEDPLLYEQLQLGEDVG